MTKRFLTVFLAIIILLLLGEILRIVFQEKFVLFPSLPQVGSYLVNHTPKIFRHMTITCSEVFLGLLMGAIFAFAISSLMLFFEPFSLVFQSWAIIFQCIPMFILANVLVSLFGWSDSIILIPVVLMIIFPLSISIFRGFISVPKEYIRYFKFLGATRLDLLFKLYIFYARRSMFSGLRIAAAIAGAGAVTGESAGAKAGIGFFIQECRRNSDLPGVYAGIFVLVILSMLVYSIIVSIERKVVPDGS